MCPGSRYYLYYEEQEKIALARTLQMDLYVLPPCTVLLGKGYVRHAGAEFPGHLNLRYHIYFVPKDIKLPDAIKVSYGSSFESKK